MEIIYQRNLNFYSATPMVHYNDQFAVCRVLCVGITLQTDTSLLKFKSNKYLNSLSTNLSRYRRKITDRNRMCSINFISLAT